VNDERITAPGTVGAPRHGGVDPAFELRRERQEALTPSRGRHEGPGPGVAA
jgi:hypothetical protein